MADWFDGPPNMTISQAMACAPKMPPKPKRPKWDNNKPIFTCDLGGIYEIVSLDDAIMHTHTLSGHCFVWNRPNAPYDEGFRKYSFRSPDNWARVSIQCRTLGTLLDGTGSRMYSGNWRDLVAKWKAREVMGVAGRESIVLLDYAPQYVYGEKITQDEVNAMNDMVLTWYKGLPEVDVPAPTDEEKARKIFHGYWNGPTLNHS